MLHIIFVASEEQRAIHASLPDMVAAAAPGGADLRFVAAPHVAVGPFLYRLSPHRTPSDVHPVPCDLIRAQLPPDNDGHVLLLDGSVYLRPADVASLAAATATLGPDQGLALPVRHNYCPDGALAARFRDGSPRFAYGVTPASALDAALATCGAMHTGDVLLSEHAVRSGVALREWDGELLRFPERIVLIRGRSARKQEGLSCPEDVSVAKDFYRVFPWREHDVAAVAALQGAWAGAELGLMADAPDEDARRRLWEALRVLRPDLAAELEAHGPKEMILRLLAAVEPYMDLFESRVEALSCLVLLYHDQLRDALRLGDREFWSAFSRYTLYDDVVLSKLLYLKV